MHVLQQKCKALINLWELYIYHDYRIACIYYIYLTLIIGHYAVYAQYMTELKSRASCLAR